MLVIICAPIRLNAVHLKLVTVDLQNLKGAHGDQVYDLLWVQLASYLEGGPLMWMMIGSIQDFFNEHKKKNLKVDIERKGVLGFCLLLVSLTFFIDLYVGSNEISLLDFDVNRHINRERSGSVVECLTRD